MSRAALLYYARGEELRPSYIEEVLNLLKGGGIHIETWINNRKEVESLIEKLPEKAIDEITMRLKRLNELNKEKK